MTEKGYLRLSDTVKVWKEEVRQHCFSGKEHISQIFHRLSHKDERILGDSTLDDLNQIRHELDEILDHLK